MRILEFKHVAPFNGCWWRWEYVAVDEDGVVIPIVFTDGHLTAEKVVAVSAGGDFGFYTDFFKEFTWLPWDATLYDEIPSSYIPAFADFAKGRGLEFLWYCGSCGNPQYELPIDWSPSSCYSCGGINWEADGWLCNDCIAEKAWQEEWYWAERAQHLAEEKRLQAQRELKED